MPDFDCSITNGRIIGQDMPKGFPEPAQKEVITSMVAEKIKERLNGKSSPPVKLWTPDDPDHPLAGRVFIMDGQHRFVAACALKEKIAVEFKKYGTAGYLNGWKTTVQVDIVPAKATLQAQIAKTQAKWSGTNNSSRQ